jgi:hypothetical protein
MWFFFNFIAAAALTIVQIAFLSHLPPPFPDISLPVVAITLAVVAEAPLAAAVWALTAGSIEGLHGLFGFGPDIVALFLALAAEHALSIRFLANRSRLATFLLAAAGSVVVFAVFLVGDGLRILSGYTPYLIAQDAEPFLAFLLGAAANGLLAVGLAAVASAVRRRLHGTFLYA